MKFRVTVPVSFLILIFALAGFRNQEPKRFLKGNLHTHSYWSDGNTFPQEVARWYRDHGYQFLAVTDHNILQEGRKTKVIARDTVVLKTLAAYRGEFEKKGEFLILNSEEISDASEKRPVHLNGFNLTQIVKPAGGITTGESTEANVKAIRKALENSETPEWIMVNHPNFGWGLSTDDLARSGARFFEVFNGHPSVRNYGDSAHPSTEVMWDRANKWRIDNGLPLLLGTATDDAHQYDQYGVGKANPGRGWVMVRAAELTPLALYQAMYTGDFYSSTGVELADFSSTSKRLNIRIKEEPGVRYKTEFIGWRKGKDQPEILKTMDGTKASYKRTGNELFVRARITSGKTKANPFAEGDVEMAWTQPVK
jgi:hypothetical protein